MKNKLSFLFLSAFLNLVVSAQNCEQMIPFKQGASITYKNYDDKQKLTSSHKHTYVKVDNDGETVTTTIKMEMYDKKNEPQGEPVEFTMKCQKGLIKMDMSRMMPKGAGEMFKGMEIKMKGDDLEYPATFIVGETLKSSKMQMEVTSQGAQFATMNYQISNRKVEAKETITTPAGTFECYKIVEEYDSETTMNIMGMSMPGIKVKGKTIIWYNAEVGSVKTESYNEKGKLENTMILEEIKK